MNPIVRPAEKTAIFQSLKFGMVPRIGLHHLQVGRLDEIQAILKDLEQIEQGGSAVRFIIGRYGSGKSFFLNLCRSNALAKRFVVVQADITLDRRLHGSSGQARSLYSELMQNMAVKAKPEGGALSSIVERWISDLQHEVKSAKGTDADLASDIHVRLKPLQEYVSGHDFATVIEKYLEGYVHHNDALMTAALRWLRGEFATKTEARQALGVRSVIDDTNFYDHLKLIAGFVRLAGYVGLLVSLDEMGVLSHRLNHSIARNSNYEAILRIVNDCVSGGARGIGFLFAGIDGFVEDSRRGLYGYEALHRRLKESFSIGNLKDLSGPVVRLANLTQNELYVLLHKIRNLAADGDPSKHALPDEAIVAFMQHCQGKLGAMYFQTPSDVIRPFVALLMILGQNPGADWKTLLPSTSFDKSADPDLVVASEPTSSPSAAGNEPKTFVV